MVQFNCFLRHVFVSLTFSLAFFRTLIQLIFFYPFPMNKTWYICVFAWFFWIMRRWGRCCWNSDDRDTSGMGCFSVLCRLRAFSLARVCGFMSYDIYYAVLFLTSCVGYTCCLRIYAFLIVIKTCHTPPVDCQLECLDARTLCSPLLFLSSHPSLNTGVASVSLPFMIIIIIIIIQNL